MKKSLLIVGLMSMVSCISWFLGKETTEIKMQQEIEQIELQYTEEIECLNSQYTEEIEYLNSQIEHYEKELEYSYEEINDLNNQIEQYKEQVNELQNEIETEAQQEEYNNSTSNYDSYDSDSDGDDQYDNEYADPDDVYVDENGIIIYDKYGTSRNSSFNNARDNVTTNEPTQAKYYYTSGGKSYHSSKNCPTLSRSKNVQYGQTSKTDPCNMCCK